MSIYLRSKSFADFLCWLRQKIKFNSYSFFLLYRYPESQSGHIDFINEISSFNYYPGRKSLSSALDQVSTDPLFQPGTKPEDATVVIFLTGGKSPSTKKDDENAIRKLTDQGYRVVLIAVGDDATPIMGNKDYNNDRVGSTDSQKQPTTIVVTNPHPDSESDIDGIVKSIMKGTVEKF